MFLKEKKKRVFRKNDPNIRTTPKLKTSNLPKSRKRPKSQELMKFVFSKIKSEIIKLRNSAWHFQKIKKLKVERALVVVVASVL